MYHAQHDATLRAIPSDACPSVAPFQLPMSPFARAARHVAVGQHALPPWKRAVIALTFALPVVALWAAVIDSPASANGQTVSIFDTVQGPYRVEVRVSPPTPRVGSLHMSVVLQSTVNMQPVHDASVWVRAIGPAPDSLFVGPVNAEPTTELLNWYDLNVALPQEGEWSFALDISQGEDSTIVEFPVLVSAGGVNWGVVVVVIAALPMLVSAAWYLRRIASGRRERRSTRRRRRGGAG